MVFFSESKSRNVISILYRLTDIIQYIYQEKIANYISSILQACFNVRFTLLSFSFSVSSIKKSPFHLALIEQNFGEISINMVQRMRIELTQDTLYAPQTYASTSSAIAAYRCLYNILFYFFLNK